MKPRKNYAYKGSMRYLRAAAPCWHCNEELDTIRDSTPNKRWVAAVVNVLGYDRLVHVHCVRFAKEV